mmetsp:Transcript_33625/g.104666  ORF Transcript_33625/g.104666 Transcript_33625/m.104666 type:complete len:231 (-) Transcript_33625:240-932(-)
MGLALFVAVALALAVVVVVALLVAMAVGLALLRAVVVAVALAMGVLAALLVALLMALALAVAVIVAMAMPRLVAVLVAALVAVLLAVAASVRGTRLRGLRGLRLVLPEHLRAPLPLLLVAALHDALELAQLLVHGRVLRAELAGPLQVRLRAAEVPELHVGLPAPEVRLAALADGQGVGAGVHALLVLAQLEVARGHVQVRGLLEPLHVLDPVLGHLAPGRGAAHDVRIA